MQPGLPQRQDHRGAGRFAGPSFRRHPFVTGQVAAIRFYASVPLATAEGFVLGPSVSSPAPRSLLADQRTALEIIASQVVEVLELHHHARMLARSLDEARTSNELLESFAARISHDLRNPLTSIIGLTELANCRALTDAESSALSAGPHAGCWRWWTICCPFQLGGALRRRPVSLSAVVRDVEENLAAA